MPRSKGGPDTADNLVPACQSCNGSKSAMTLEEWADRLEADIRRIDRRRRQLRGVQEVIAQITSLRAMGSPAEHEHDWQETEPGAYRCSICTVPWSSAA
jgi:hypothetical protein